MSPSHNRISRLVYIPALCSFLPIIGIPFGISAILWGFSDWKIGGRKVVTISFLGLLSTFFLGCLIYSTVIRAISSPAMTATKTSYTKISLAFIIRYIEYYKLGHGYYPNTLDDLKEKDITFNEPAFIDLFTSPLLSPTGGPSEQQYFYEVHDDGNSYELFSVGPDKIPHTQDDIYPVVLDDYRSILGLRTSSDQRP